MSDTVLGHRLVRDYLRSLDSARVILPATQARELHEPIASHLDEVLPPSASEAAVRQKLRNRARRVRWWSGP